MHTIQLDLTINLTSRWHAGSGEGSMAVDRNIRRDSNNQPYIPGSTLKGIIRENCERLSRTLGLGEPSDPHNSNIRNSGAFGPLHLASHPVDALFGNKYEGADMYVRNARQVPGIQMGVTEMTRTAVSRARRTSLDGHLFSSEYVQPCSYKTSINGYHRHLVAESAGIPFAYAVLVAGILNIDRIGSDKSTGCGVVKIDITKATYNGKNITIDEALACISDNELAEYYELCREELEVA